MNKSTFLIAIFEMICFFAFSHCANVRIANGSDANEGEFSFAAILRREGNFSCGSTILNEKFILTAGHCVCTNYIPENVTYITIQYGLTTYTSNTENLVNVKKIYCNKDYHLLKLTFDIAIIELEESLPVNENWSRVTIAKTFNTSEKREGVVIGWGRLKENGTLSSTLQKLNVDIYEDDLCSKKFEIEHHICLGSKKGGACKGDSGTALLVDGVQVGIASFINAKCGIATEEFPNIYSRIPKYIEWITNITDNVKFAYL